MYHNPSWLYFVLGAVTNLAAEALAQVSSVVLDGT